ncbi:Bacteriohemerythrin [Azospirillaceae bacterium]|nr:bacteriohemerythrin [uncultured bacterium]
MEDLSPAVFTSLLDRHILDICENMNRLSDGEVHLVNIGDDEDRHRLIFAKYNEFVFNLIHQQDAGRIEEKFKELIKYIRVHFIVEEKIMKIHEYDGYAKHKAQHDDFTATITKLAIDISVNKSNAEDMALYIGHWLIGHMLISDMQFEESMT